MQELTPDELSTTTRSVRRRLDLSRPVDRTLVEDCLRLAFPRPGNIDEREPIVGGPGQRMVHDPVRVR